MSALVDFPMEIIDLIMDNNYLTTQDLIQCQLVCKQWRHIARPYCYKNIKISTFNSASNLLHTMKRYKETRCYVKSISLSTLMEPYIVENQYLMFDKEQGKLIFLIILLCEKNLVKIEAFRAGCFFWNKLRDMVLHSDGYLSSLKYIPKGSCCHDCYKNCYFKIISTISQRMDHLTLIQINSSADKDIVFRYIKKIVYRQLELPSDVLSYSHIKSLTVDLQDKSRYSVYTFGNFIDQNFTSLKSLTLNTHPYIGSFCEEVKDFMGLDLLENIQPNLNIRHFTVHNFFYNNLSAVYIIKKFSRLTSLNISTQKITRKSRPQIRHFMLRRVFTAVSADLMFQYMNYIQSIPIYNVDNFMIPNLVHHVSDYIQTTQFAGLVDIELQEDYDETKWWKIPMKKSGHNGEELLPDYPRRLQLLQRNIAATLTDIQRVRDNYALQEAMLQVEHHLEIVKGRHIYTYSSLEERERILLQQPPEGFRSIFDDEEESPSDNDYDSNQRTPALLRPQPHKYYNIGGTDDNKEPTTITHFQQTDTSFYPRLQLHNNRLAADDHHIQNKRGMPTMTLRFFRPLLSELHTYDICKVASIHDCILDYVPLLKESGSAIQHLRLSYTNPKGYPKAGTKSGTATDVKRRWYFNITLEKYAHLYDGTHLADILNWCPQLKSLTLNDSCLVGRQSFIPNLIKPYRSLEVLNISECQVPSNAFQEFSRCFPSLRCLNLSQVESPFPQDHFDEKQVLEIKMPHTVFDTVSCYKKDLLNHIDDIYYVRVKYGHKQIARLVGDRMSLKLCSENEYSRRTPLTFAFRIFCKDIKKLIIRYNSNNYQRFDFYCPCRQ